jgi:hypothetical protein
LRASRKPKLLSMLGFVTTTTSVPIKESGTGHRSNDSSSRHPNRRWKSSTPVPIGASSRLPARLLLRRHDHWRRRPSFGGQLSQAIAHRPGRRWGPVSSSAPPAPQPSDIDEFPARGLGNRESR